MSTSSECPRCGTKLPAKSLGGLCPRCVGNRLFAANAVAPPPVWPSDLADDAVGAKLGRYLLVQKLGEGGCGIVYAADQEVPIRRRVALKVIKLGMDTRAVVARFEAERQALAMMDHPNISKVLDAGATAAGRPYFVMELVEGARITDYCDRHRLTTTARIELFITVCQAVQHAHQKGIIHRDLKPSNILVADHDGVPVPKIIDFGIAKATGSRLTEETLVTEVHQLLGTPAYMSPEQAESGGTDLDTRSDIYSLGVVLYELLTGNTPFNLRDAAKTGPEAARRMIREAEAPRPSARLTRLPAGEQDTVATAHATSPGELRSELCGDLDWIAMKCLEKERALRYETVNALAEDLRRHLDDKPVTAGEPGASYRFRKFARRNKIGLTIAAAIVAVLLAATVVSSWQAVRASKAEREAKQNLAESEKARQEAETMSKFLTEILQSPDPKQDGRTVTVAETLGRAARRIETDLAGHPERQAKLQTTLAGTYRALGLYQEAIPLLETVRDYRLTQNGHGHSNTLSALRDLAIGYLDASRRTDALQLSETVLAGFRELYGPTHPTTLQAMSQVAWCRSVNNDYRGAIDLEKQALKFSREVNGPEHADTLMAMGQLGWFYSLARRPQDALALQTELLRLKRSSLGPEHPDTLNTLITLAASQRQLGQHDVAAASLQQTIALSRKVKGPTHPETLWALGTLGETYEAAGRRDEAIKIYEDVLTISREVNGENHGRTRWAVNKIAAINKRAGATNQWDAPQAEAKSAATTGQPLN